MPNDLKEMVKKFKAYYKEQIGSDFPQDPKEQLMGAVKAVFRSWDNPRAIYYRRMNDIPSSWGTAVNVQTMVFGNTGNTSGTGVAFTRNPATGENKLFGEFLVNAQGEDVVAGVRTPQKIDELKEIMPEVYEQFNDVAHRLEKHYRDMQDMEFTIENGKLYMLQTRNGKRTATAAIKIACDLVDEGMISKEEAVCMVDPKQLDALLHPQFDAAALKAAKEIGTGLAASPGAACGKVVFTAEEATEEGKKGEKVVLVRLETSPEDIEGMNHAQGILTVRGGMTSHAAVVARGMGTCCVSGCGDIVNARRREATLTLGGRKICRRRLHLSGRLHRQDLRRSDPDRSRFRFRRLWPSDGLGRRGPDSCRSAPTPTPRETPRRLWPLALRASVCAAPSTCSSRAPESKRCAR